MSSRAAAGASVARAEGTVAGANAGLRDGSTGAVGSEGADAGVRAIAEHIARGAEPDRSGRVGLELEHFIVRAQDDSSIPYRDDPLTGALGLSGILEALAPFYDEQVFEPQADGSKQLIGLARRCSTLTLEPGAQLEISISPLRRIADVQAVYQAFRRELDPLLDSLGYQTRELGYRPTACARDIPLIPKERYRLMDAHFSTTGQHGLCMMRATAATQVSIDYRDERDAVRKFRLANALSPLFAFITDNSPIFEGMPIGSGVRTPSGLALPKRMVRMAVWDDVDAQRSGTAPHTFDEDFGFDAYARAILGAQAIFTTEDDGAGGRQNVSQGARSFAEALAGREPDLREIEHILSLFFFDARFKTYVEIRAADSLPPDYAFAFAALVKGLFYDDGILDELAAELASVDAKDIAEAKAALRARAWEALVYGRPVTEWLDGLIERALCTLDEDDRRYLEPLAQLVAERRTLVDSLVDRQAGATTEDEVAGGLGALRERYLACFEREGGD
ncbi:MAG: hypothetical protein LBH64_02620, partial [Coriobacteriales bacterium]|nr:hypothetical protein [Coriobacteriales bacterium]